MPACGVHTYAYTHTLMGPLLQERRSEKKGERGGSNPNEPTQPRGAAATARLPPPRDLALQRAEDKAHEGMEEAQAN